MSEESLTVKEGLVKYYGLIKSCIMAVILILSIIGATYLYYRKPIGLVVGILLVIASTCFLKLSNSNSIWLKLFSAALAVLGLAVFFTALFAKVRMLLITFDISLGVCIVYFIVTVIRAIIALVKKQTDTKILVSITCVLCAICVLGSVIGLATQGKRFVVNHVVSMNAEGYDNAAETAISGKYMYINRDKDYTIRTIVYTPARVSEGNMPAIVNIHGGSWVFGWASVMDRECQNLADELGVIVVNLDYRLLYDRPFPSQQQEVVDTVHYLYDHSEEMNIDKNNIFIYGQSAGGHIAAGAGIMLTKEKFPLKGEILFYPFTDFGIELDDPEWKMGADLLVAAFKGNVDLATPALSPASAPNEVLQNHCPVFLEIGSADALEVQGEALAKRYTEAGVDMTVLRLDGATHGFLAKDTTDRKEVAFQKGLEDECMSAMKEFVKKCISQN